MTKNNKSELIQRVAKMYNEGVTQEAMAERLGVTVRTVGGYISRARVAGLVGGPHGSNVGRLLRSLPPEVDAWLKAQIPEGGTITEMIRAIVIDAYYEENHVAYPDTGM